MGIVRQLIQVAVTEAIRDRTIAGAGVHDSLIKALPLIMKGSKVSPVVAVSIEDSLSQAQGDGLFRTDVEMTLMFQLAMAKSVTVEVISGEGESQTTEALEIGDTDAALEASLNLLDRQIKLALSDPNNEWAELFRTLCPVISKISDIRLVDPETGRKHAARIIEMTMHPIAEPSPAQSDTEVVEAGLDQMASIADYADLAAILRASLHQSGDGLFDWQAVQAKLFTTKAVPAAIGVGTPDEEAEVLIEDVSLNIDSTIDEASDE